jgi:hypothetical protein
VGPSIAANDEKRSCFRYARKTLVLVMLVTSVYMWTSITAAPALASHYTQLVDSGNSVNAVSCLPGTTDCVISDSAGQAFYATNVSATSAATWKAWAGPTGESPSQAVACPSTSLCLLADGKEAAGGKLYYATSLGGSWSEAYTPSYGVDGVSCVSSAFCVDGQDGEGYFRYSTSPASTSWELEDQGTASMNSVFCLSSSFCAIVDSAGDVHIADSTSQIESSSWTSTDIDGTGALHGVACTSTTACVAVDGAGNVINLAISGSTATATKHDIDASNDLTAITCTGTTTCVAVDNQGNIFVTTNAGTSWTEQEQLGEKLTSVSCASATLCITTDTTGEIAAFAPTTSGTGPSNVVRPTIFGPHTYGKEETASPGTWTGSEPITYTYQWERCEGSTCTAISGATASSYVAAEADIGKTLRVKVTATNAFGASSEVSTVSETVTGPPVNTGAPTITGQATEWHSEYTTRGTWIGTPEITKYEYQWYLCEPGCIPIQGDTAAEKLVASPTEVGKTLMVEVTATNADGSTIAFSNPSPALTANACGLYPPDESAHHCYGIAYWSAENLGVSSQIRTFFASVPEPREDFVTNEMWDLFSRGGWVEAGDIAGRDAGFDYFTAQKIPAGYETEGFYFTDITSIAPEADSWFEDTIHAAGYGVWYIYLAGQHVWSWGSQPGSAAAAEDGMENTNDNIYASGQSMNMSYWSASNGQSYEGWSGDYGAPQGSGCITLTGDTSESFSNECGGAQAPAARLATPNTRAHGATKPDLDAVALSAARSDGDSSPAEQQIVKTTVAAGSTTLSPPGSKAPTESAAARKSLSKKAELVVLHGHFTLRSVPLPQGASSPAGSVLSLVVEEATGDIVFTALTNHASSLHSLQALGPVSDITNPDAKAGAQKVK